MPSRGRPAPQPGFRVPPIQRDGTERVRDARGRAESLDGLAVLVERVQNVAAGLTAARQPAHGDGGQIGAAERVGQRQCFVRDPFQRRNIEEPEQRLTEVGQDLAPLLGLIGLEMLERYFEGGTLIGPLTEIAEARARRRCSVTRWRSMPVPGRQVIECLQRQVVETRRFFLGERVGHSIARALGVGHSLVGDTEARRLSEVIGEIGKRRLQGAGRQRLDHLGRASMHPDTPRRRQPSYKASLMSA